MTSKSDSTDLSLDAEVFPSEAEDRGAFEKGSDNSCLSRYFSTTQCIVVALLILTGLIMRWYALGDGPFHHDESMHAMFGLYYQDHPNTHYHKYNPMMHGPLLYHTVRAVYNLFGISDWSARFPVAFFGSLFIFLPLLFRRFFKPQTMVALIAAVSLSPTMIYWSRFIIHDYFVLCGIFLMLYGVVLARPQNKAALVLLAITLQWCTKANLFVTLAILFGYLILEWVVKVVIQDEDDFLLLKMFRNLWRYKVQVFLSLLACIFIYCYFYTSEFRYAKGILDGLYREVFPYWLHHHNIERIKGPFAFNFFFLSWYESLFMLAFLWHAFLLYGQLPKRIKILSGVFLFSLLLLTSHYSTPEMMQKLPDLQPWAFFKLKTPFDIFWCFALFYHAVVLSFFHMLRREDILAFTGFYFAANFWTYSYLGEKVPWLATYPLVAGMVYLALFFQDYYERHRATDWKSYPLKKTILWLGIICLAFGLFFLLEKSFSNDNLIAVFLDSFKNTKVTGSHTLFLFGLFLTAIALLDSKKDFFGRHNLLLTIFIFSVLYNTRVAFLTNFENDAKASEYISQVHTTHEFDALMKNIRAEIEDPSRAKAPQILVTKDAVWPATWYFRGLSEYKFSDPDNKPERFDYIIQNFKEPPENVPAGFSVKKIKLRGWFVPDFSKMTLSDFVYYAVFHEPWSDTGYSYVHLLIKDK